MTTEQQAREISPADQCVYELERVLEYLDEAGYPANSDAQLSVTNAIAFITQAAEDKRIADAVRGAWAINCGACKGRGWTDEGDPETGSAIMDCDVCNGCGKVKVIPASVLEGE